MTQQGPVEQGKSQFLRLDIQQAIKKRGHFDSQKTVIRTIVPLASRETGVIAIWPSRYRFLDSFGRNSLLLGSVKFIVSHYVAEIQRRRMMAGINNPATARANPRLSGRAEIQTKASNGIKVARPTPTAR